MNIHFGYAVVLLIFAYPLNAVLIKMAVMPVEQVGLIGFDIYYFWMIIFQLHLGVKIDGERLGRSKESH